MNKYISRSKSREAERFLDTVVLVLEPADLPGVKCSADYTGVRTCICNNNNNNNNN